MLARDSGIGCQSAASLMPRLHQRNMLRATRNMLLVARNMLLANINYVAEIQYNEIQLVAGNK